MPRKITSWIRISSNKSWRTTPSADNAAQSITRDAGSGGARPRSGQKALCPACRRISDKFPAGVVELRGAVERQQKDDIVRLARHQEEAEKSEHPLNRIIKIDEDADGIVIKTTDIHLPRRIGEAVERAFHGSLNEDCDEGGYFVRVNWTAKI